MFTWALCFLSFFIGLRFFMGDANWFGVRRDIQNLHRAIHLFVELEETLASGVVPAPERWQALEQLPSPWGELAYPSLRHLQKQGGALLPTLRRLRSLAEDHRKSLWQGQARSAQALGQAWACAALVPLFGSVLYAFLPGVQENQWKWIGGCSVAFALTLVAAFWMVSIAESARWAGLKVSERPWVLSALCAGERFLALVRSGMTPDLAWLQAMEFLCAHTSDLAAAWGNSVWFRQDFQRESKSSRSDAGTVFVEAGDAARRAIQVSLMEGRPCTEKVEGIFASLSQQIEALSQRELGLLGSRALKPLFVLVAPALLGLLGFGFFLTWKKMTSDIF